MGFTETDFAAALPSLRPALIQVARYHCRCSREDAEDLVSQTVLLALPLLSQYQPETGRAGLRRWLRTILMMAIREDKVRATREVETVPLEAARSLAAPDAFASFRPVRALFRSLPYHERVLVNEWLAGYDQSAIARRHRLHRNTVGTRLESAFATLRIALPDADALTYSGGLVGFCSRVSLYIRPRGVWPSWFRQHPPEVHFARYRRSIQTARKREKKG